MPTKRKSTRRRRGAAGVLLSHLGRAGEARMVDVSVKAVTAREAVASAVVVMQAKVLAALWRGTLPKGDGLAVARVAGILAAKKTPEIIPLCHPLTIEFLQVDFAKAGAERLCVTCTARTSGKTGVEMEAMVGVAVAALTIYDMVKSADKSVAIGPVQLESKRGGKSGAYRRR